MTKRGRAFSKGEKVSKGIVHSDRASTHILLFLVLSSKLMVFRFMFVGLFNVYMGSIHCVLVYSCFLTLNLYSWFKL